MNLVVDIGNTRIKVAAFRANVLEREAIVAHYAQVVELAQSWGVEASILASVGKPTADLASQLQAFGPVWELNSQLPLPIKLDYHSPESLGADRLAAAVGGSARFPAKSVLIFDAGTCLTTEFVSRDGVYQGGAIAPGLQMRLRAMHQLTARLPLATVPELIPPLTAKSTEACLQSGAINGLLAEIEGTILRYREQYTDLQVILCGGDSKIFEKRVKPAIFVLPKLVLYGLNEILLHNAQ